MKSETLPMRFNMSICLLKLRFIQRSSRACVVVGGIVENFRICRFGHVTGAEAERSVVLFQEHRLVFSVVVTRDASLRPCVQGVFACLRRELGRKVSRRCGLHAAGRSPQCHAGRRHHRPRHCIPCFGNVRSITGVALRQVSNDERSPMVSACELEKQCFQKKV